MCGEVWPGHSSPDTDVYGVLTDAGEAAAMGVRGYPRAIWFVGTASGLPLFRAD
jgi:hypothetical protein